MEELKKMKGKKRIILVALLAALALLAACAAQTAPEPEPDPTPAGGETAPAPEPAPDPTPAGGGETASAPERKASRIDFQREAAQGEEDWALWEYATVTAYTDAGDVLWRYTTPEYEMTELDRTGEIGWNGDGYYLVEGGAVVALDAQTGAVLWRNGDFGGASAASALGEDAIYLCGFYGPDFYAVGYDGTTRKRIEAFDPDYYWATRIELRGGEAAVYLTGGAVEEGEEKVFTVDLATFAADTGK